MTVFDMCRRIGVLVPSPPPRPSLAELLGWRPPRYLSGFDGPGTHDYSVISTHDYSVIYSVYSVIPTPSPPTATASPTDGPVDTE